MRRIPIVVLLVVSLLAAGCGSDSTATAQGEDQDASASQSEGSTDPISIVVTTNILGDVVSAVVGDLAEVEVIMPLGVDPHDFAPSVKQAESMENADLLVINGANFEEGMAELIESVLDSGTPVFAFADVIELIEGGEDDHGHEDEHADEEHKDDDEHADEDEHGDEEHADEDEHGDEEHEDEHEHSHGGDDPHLWTDPVRMIAGVEGLAAALATIDGIDADALATQAGEYVESLQALDSEIETLLEDLPAEQRVLVTNHEVFAYFADRYDFEVVGAVIPSLTTSAESSISGLEELAETIEAESISAIFAETTQSSDLAEALADQVGGDVSVVELFTESLGEAGSGAETYIDMMRTNATLIADALAGS